LHTLEGTIVSTAIGQGTCGSSGVEERGMYSKESSKRGRS